MEMSNFCGKKTLKFDNVVDVLLSEEARRKSLGSAKTSGSALSVDQRGTLMNREKKKIASLNRGEVIPSQRVSGFGGVVREAYLEG